jgi:hypothetical protein
MALKLDILANTRQFVGEMKKSGASVEDISDALTEMMKDGDKAFDKLEPGFRDMVKSSNKAEQAVKDIGDKGFKKASKGADDFKDEANSSLRETAASISSVEDGLGAVQEIAANAFVGFGPVGAGAGLVAALGFGLLLENMTAQKEAADEIKQALGDAYRTAAEEGRNYLSEAQIISAASDILFDPAKKAQAAADAKAIGVDLQTFVRAMAGDEDAIAVAIELGNQKYQERLDTLKLEDRAQAGKVLAVDKEAREIERVNGLLGTQLKNHKDNQEAVRTAQQLEANLGAEQRSQIQRTRDADTARWSAYAASKAKATAPIEQKVRIVPDTSAWDAKVRQLQQLSLTRDVIVRPGQVVWE